MRSVGLIVEYNPFHNGHLYHLQRAAQQTGAEVVIAVMSGHFLQRGEPALTSKWSRTKMALLAGVDLVVELPYAFSVQKAETFAFGAISILDALKSDSFCFGSESGKVEEFLRTYETITKHKQVYDAAIRTAIKKGMSYPAALSQAFLSLGQTEQLADLSQPNNILGYHYIEAAMQINSSMKAVTIERKNAGYHDEALTTEQIASATAIRKALVETGELTSIINYVPATTYEELHHYLDTYKQYSNWEHYWPFLQYRLLHMTEEEAAAICEVEEGIEYRLIKIAAEANSFQSFMRKLKTKRYTWTRLQRMCVHILTNTTKTAMAEHAKEIKYLRLLGMSQKGRAYLQQVKKKLNIPLISKLSAFPKEKISLDIHASSMFAQGYPEPARTRLRRLEYEQPPLFVHRNV